MEKKTAWEEAAASEGTTESERALTKAARKAFLSLWSYSNVYTDRGRANGKGDGDEMCDLLVVFGNNVLIFSDKHCEYQIDKPIEVAWPRWYRGAIHKSVIQLQGAENFAKRYPNRLFLDKSCQHPLPVQLPDPAVAKYFLISVTRGSNRVAEKLWGGGSSGSLILDTQLEGKAAHEEAPFRFGFPLPNRRFVHTFDEVTLDLFLDELDTVPDLVDYLTCKEAFLTKPGSHVLVYGEEDLLALYMSMAATGKKTLFELPDNHHGIVPEGEWEHYRLSPQRFSRKEANKISYVWDRLIELQSSFIRAGTAIAMPHIAPNKVEHERIIRALAEEPRVSRRMLAEHFIYARGACQPNMRFFRMALSPVNPNRAFVFVAAWQPEFEDYEAYRFNRVMALTAYCHAIKLQLPHITEAVGIACEPLHEDPSIEFLVVDHTKNLTEEEAQHWREACNELGILENPNIIHRPLSPTHREFPVPFEFEAPTFTDPDTGMPINRKERRRREKEARSKKKR